MAECSEDLVPATKVLAIASHVVYGYVGNTMATFCMQTLGCEVSAINTVNFSNHTGYGQWTGPRTQPEVVAELYAGLRKSNLTDFDVLLTGYIPSAAVLHEVALIARDLKSTRTGRRNVLWILDPVMGDQGKLYVSAELVSGYKDIIGRGEPDLVVPNGFELELISGVSVTSGEAAGDAWQAQLDKVKAAIQVLHQRDGIRMVVVTSVRVSDRPGILCVVGSEMRSDRTARAFLVEIPALNCFFSGTGDMFAGLMVGRLREEYQAADPTGQNGWASSDRVVAVETPLARATIKVLSSMSAVLEKTMVARDREMEAYRSDHQSDEGSDRLRSSHLAQTKAAEVRAVRNAADLRQPTIIFKATSID